MFPGKYFELPSLLSSHESFVSWIWKNLTWRVRNSAAAFPIVRRPVELFLSRGTRPLFSGGRSFTEVTCDQAFTFANACSSVGCKPTLASSATTWAGFHSVPLIMKRKSKCGQSFGGTPWRANSRSPEVTAVTLGSYSLGQSVEKFICVFVLRF